MTREKALRVALTIEAARITDFYILRREEHDGRRWEAPAKYGTMLCRSDRLVPQSDVEGTGWEWREIMLALRGGYACGFERVSVDPCKAGWRIWSPKQIGMMEPVLICSDSARHLAANIARMVGPTHPFGEPS